MTQYSLEDIHTLALVGHAGAGKTLLAEALLHAAGAIPAMGSLERGTTVCDFDPQEKKLQHSLEASLCSKLVMRYPGLLAREERYALSHRPADLDVDFSGTLHRRLSAE